MIEIREIAESTELQDETLRRRATRCKKSSSRQFLATVNGSEAGYVSMDHRSDLECGVIYEVFVLPVYRHSGAGSKLMLSAEELARALGCTRTLVVPRALDSSINQRWLEQWYERKGYERRSDETGEYEKRLD